MTDPDRFKILFVCTGNTARSILAEGLTNALGGGRFEAFSAGSQPKGVVNPLALRTLANWGIATDGFRSKSWDEFARPGAPALDFVVTVCDNAAREACPFWPGQPVTAHWGVPDPAAVDGADEIRAAAFLDAAVALKRRIELMMALPMATLDRQRLGREMKQIGER